MRSPLGILLLSQLVSVGSCTSLVSTTSTDLRPHLVHEFPLETYLHSLAVRKRDGNIMVTVTTTAQIYLVSTGNVF